MPEPAFSGIVLTGGASSRMGRDKALLEVRGRPLAVIASSALQEAGADEVLAVGGDREGLAALGLRTVADDAPGEGPLGGMVTGLARVHHALAVVLSCDLPDVDAATVRALVDALAAAPAADGALGVQDDGWQQLLCSAWRVERALPVLAAAFRAGERAPRRAVVGLHTVAVTALEPDALHDVDRPEDLRRYDAGREHP